MKVNANQIVKIVAIALPIGVISAIVTAVVARYTDAMSPLVGLIFGLAVILLVWLTYRQCSAFFVLCMTVSAAAAYLAAVWGGLLLADAVGVILPRGRLGDLDSRTFLMGGLIGALIVNASLLFFLSPKTGWRLPVKAIAWSFGGAVFGCLGALLSDSVGTMMVTLAGRLTRTHMTGNNLETALYSAYLIWQTGMAVLIPLMLQRATLLETDQPAPVPRSAAQLSIPGRLFFACLFLIAIPIFTDARDYLRSWRLQHEIARLEREIPSADNLPEIAPHPLGEMVILHDMDGYSEAGGTEQIVPALTQRVPPGGEVRKHAKRIVYRVAYVPAGGTSGTADSQRVTVSVSELPNSEWARYDLINSAEYPSWTRSYLASVRVNRFGNALLMYPTTTGNYLTAYWPSGNRVVVVSYSGQRAEEIVRQYLVKYPSSL